MDPLVESLQKLHPLLQLCQVDCLASLIDDVLIDPRAAVANALKVTVLLAPSLTSQLAREVTLVNLIMRTATNVLNESLNNNNPDERNN